MKDKGGGEKFGKGDKDRGIKANKAPPDNELQKERRRSEE